MKRKVGTLTDIQDDDGRKRVKTQQHRVVESTTSESQQPRITFMDLPLELRLIIYEYALTTDIVLEKDLLSLCMDGPSTKSQ